MMKQLSSLAALAAVAAATLLTGCATDPEAAARQAARNDAEYITGSNLPRPKSGKPAEKITTAQAEELRRQLELTNDVRR